MIDILLEAPLHRGVEIRSFAHANEIRISQSSAIHQTQFCRIAVMTQSMVAYQIDVGVEPEGMAVSPDGAWAVNTSETTNMVHWIDTDKRVLVDNTLVDSRPRYAEFDKPGKRLWVSAEIGGTVSVIDTATHKVEHTIQFNIKGLSKDKIQPVGIRLSDDGRYSFVALGPTNQVAVVNAKTFEVEKYLLVGRR